MPAVIGVKSKEILLDGGAAGIVVRSLSVGEVLEDQRQGEDSYLSSCLGLLVVREEPDASIAAGLLWTKPDQTIDVLTRATGLTKEALLALDFPDFCRVVDAWVEVNAGFFSDLVAKLKRRAASVPLQ